MDTELYQSRSYYLPRAFYISIRPEYLDENGKPLLNHLPVFMHEYTHLIQDSTTYFGAISFINFYDFLMDVSKFSKENKKGGKLSLPLIQFSRKNGEWSNVLEMIRKCHDPREKWDNTSFWAFESFNDFDMFYATYQDKPFRVPRVSANFVDNTTGRMCEHTIGVREIKEAYALSVENIYRGERAMWAPNCEFQYFAIERILGKYFDCEILNEHIITICHWSLQDIHPPENFYHIVEYLRKKSTALPEAMVLYSDLRQRHLKLNHNLKESVHENFQLIIDNQGKGGSDDYLHKILKWYKDEILKYLDKVENTSDFFPLDTEFCKRSTNLDALISKYPIYLYENASNGEAFSITGSEFDAQVPFVLRSLIMLGEQIFRAKVIEYSCDWLKCCDLKKYQFKDDSCKTTPWKKGSLTRTCPFGMAAKYLEINDIDEFL